MKTFILSVFVLLALSSFSFSQEDECASNPSACMTWSNEPAITPVKWNPDPDKGGYVEQLTIRVLDPYGRAVTGALVNATWTVTNSRGTATTKTLQTGTNGRVNFTLMNVEYDPEDTEMTYVVRAGYANANVTQSFEAYNGIVERTLQLPVYNVMFRVRDKEYRPIEGVTIRVDKKYTTRTSKNGIAYMILGMGNHIAIPEYGDLEKEVKFSVENDTTVGIELKLYNLELRVVDEQSTPLEAQVHIGTHTEKSSLTGWTEFTNITTNEVVVDASYGRYKKSISLDLNNTRQYTIVFDSTPPKIEEVFAQYQQGSIQIRAVVRDDGTHASGLVEDKASILLFYLGEDSVQKTVPMYAVGYGLYEGLIPSDNPQTVVKYTIQATDADGNSATNSDTYVISAPDPSDFENIPAAPEQVAPEGLGFNWALVPIIAVVGIIIAIGGYLYYNSKRPPSQEEHEEPLPPREKQEYSYEHNLDEVPKKGGEPPSPPKV